MLILVATALAAPALAQTVHYDLASTSVLRINLPVSQAVTVTMSESVGKIVSADSGIAEAQPITDRSLYLVGRAFGTTTVNLFSASGNPVGLLAVEAGWCVTEVGRQPWIIRGVLLVSEAVTPMPGLVWSLLMSIAVYLFLGCVVLVLLYRHVVSVPQHERAEGAGLDYDAAKAAAR